MTASGTDALHVVKIGGSVLPDLDGFARAAALIKDLRRRNPLAVVVSAQQGHTDALEAELDHVAPGAPAAVRAAHLATGELRAGALLTAAVGDDAVLVSPTDVFRLEGDPAAAIIARVRIDDVERALELGRIPVVPGFVGLHESGDIATMGRGGGDLSAVALADALGAERAVLVKGQVAGLYTRDPVRHPRDAVLIETMTHEDVHEIIDRDGTAVVQLTALDLAHRRALTLEVRGLGSSGTLVQRRC